MGKVDSGKIGYTQFDQFTPETVLQEGVERVVGQLGRLELAVFALVADVAARFYGVPACEVYGCATGPARTLRLEARRARDLAVYVLHTSLGYSQREAARIYGRRGHDGGARIVRRVEDARETDADLDRFLDRLDGQLRRAVSP